MATLEEVKVKLDRVEHRLPTRLALVVVATVGAAIVLAGEIWR